MHNTYISLDMFFIGADGRIVRIAENAKPQSDTLIPSGGLTRGVLEVIAGTARKLVVNLNKRTPLGAAAEGGALRASLTSNYPQAPFGRAING
jgi:uncharacterized membrane protein (UPF0127 family)